MDVRLIRKTDIRGFHASLDAVAKEKRFLAMTQAPPLGRLSKFVEDNLERGFAHYVAEDDGHIVGWCDVVQRSGGEADSMRHRATLGIGILREYRGRGIGERLVRAAVAHTWRIGLLRIDLEVRADNLAAIRLYEKLGFRCEGRRPFALQLDGEYFDLIQMGLLNERGLDAAEAAG